MRQRFLLDAGWSICSAPAASSEAPSGQARWLPIREAAPVAAALRERGEWSLDAPPVDFDASDWWYRLRFDRPPLARDTDVVLGFDGLATLAQVQCNGTPLPASDNMFVRSEHDITRLLRDRGNELLIRCCALGAELARRRPRPRWRTPMVAHQQLRWFRTTLLGRTPGWSPPAAVVGPWRPVWLAQGGVIDPADLQLDISVEGGAG
ncbi:MAG TPA: hypothetical protein VFF05_07080, partial [Rudaea sp.]|nr:hypothetical protein [Rudaea sp.]